MLFFVGDVLPKMVGKALKGNENSNPNNSICEQGQRVSFNIHSIISPTKKMGNKRSPGSALTGVGGMRSTQMTGTKRSSPISPRLSPSKVSPGHSPGYAGAKFSDPPSPNALPKPPPHWTSSSETQKISSPRCSEISNQLKVLLNVQA